MAAEKPPQPAQLLYAGFDVLTGGLDSGIAPISLPGNKYAYGTNTTARGGYIKPRPAFSKVNLILDSGISLAGLVPQGACYYDPDFGQESVIAQCGGHLLQFLPDTDGNAYVYDRSIQTQAIPPIYDLNPAGVRQAWLWQSENYVIVNDGISRPIFFNGVSSRRSVAATFTGNLEESFIVPAIGQAVNLSLSSAFIDGVGSFINLSPLNLFPFLMVVTAVNVGGDPTVITAENVTGLSALGSNIPIATPVNSTPAPRYYGTLLTPINSNGSPAIQMPAPGGSLTITIQPSFTGVVGDQITLTDGTGPLTSYSFTVTFIGLGGSIITVTNNSAPYNLFVSPGFPIIASESVPSELPIGRMGAYVQGRNWISLPSGKAFIASDQVGDSSGTQSLNYRDAVLKWSINTTQFSTPGGSGSINCIVALSSLDASLGQGPLQVLCDNDIFTCSASDNSATWAATTTPILSESAIGFGGCGQDAALVINSDLLMKSNDASIHSLKLSREDFAQWANLPVSEEMNRVIVQENKDLIQYLPFAEDNNRALLGCSPIDESGVICAQGLMALDYDVTSSLQGKLPPVWDGVWKGLNFMKLISGKFSNLDRTFALCWNFESSQPELWEILDGGMEDANGSQSTPIVWSFETSVFFTGPNEKYVPKRLEGGEIYISNLVGSAKIQVWYRPDFDQCWHNWTTIQLCADNLPLGAEQYRMRVGLGKPSDSESDPTVNKMTRDGRFFQLRFEITGSLTMMGGICAASGQTQPLYATPTRPEGPLP